MNSYYLRDVDAKEREIRAAMPGAKLSRLDYGFKLVAERNGLGFIVMQPERSGVQEFINRSISDAIEFLRSGPTCNAQASAPPIDPSDPNLEGGELMNWRKRQDLPYIVGAAGFVLGFVAMAVLRWIGG